MTTLAEKLTAPDVRPKVVSACVDLVEREVDSKRGLSGAAIKAGFKVVQTLKPGMIRNVVDTLLPEFASALQGIYERSIDGAADPSAAFTGYLSQHPDEAADALLRVTDTRSERVSNATLKKTYQRMRGSAKEHVAAAVPGLAGTLAPFVK